MTAVGNVGEFVGLGGPRGKVAQLPQFAFVASQFGNVGGDEQHPAVRLHGFYDPKPTPVDEIAFKRAARHLAPARDGGGEPGIHVGMGDDSATASLPVAAHQLRPQRCFAGLDGIALAECGIGVTQPVFRIVDGNEGGRFLAQLRQFVRNLLSLHRLLVPIVQAISMVTMTGNYEL